MHILALTFGGSDCASSHYRIAQYIEPLRARHGIFVEAEPAQDFARWQDVASYDAVILQKKLLARGKLERLRSRARRLIYDLDDAVWHAHRRSHAYFTKLRTENRLRGVARAANLCLVANGFLAEHLAQWSSDVQIFPMALDERIWTAKAQCPPASSGPLRIGWTGAPVNLPYIEALEPVLLRVMAQHPSAVRMVVACGKRPSFKRLRNYEYVAYEPGREPETVRSFDIGLLPLPGDPFSQGKSPIKALQYMASGVPVVASDGVGTREMFEGGGAILARNEDGFQQGLETLIESAAERERLGAEGRRRFMEAHAVSGKADELAGILRRLA